MSVSWKPAALALTAVLALSACTYQDPAAEPAVTATAVATSAATSSPQPGDDATAEASAAESTSTAAATVSPDTVAPSKTTDLASWDVPVTVDDAVKRASGAAEGTMHQVELGYSDYYRAWTYKVGFQAGSTDTTVVVDAATGDIIANEKDTEDDEDREKAVDITEMSPQEAIAAALKVSSGTVTEWTLERDDDVQVYTVEVAKGDDSEDVTVQTKSGKANLD